MSLARGSGPHGFGQRATTISSPTHLLTTEPQARQDPNHVPREPSRVSAMPNQKLRKPGARTWREVRAEAIKVGRLNEEALQAHKRCMLAAEQQACTERIEPASQEP